VLFARGQAYAIPAMTEAWRKVQPHLLGNKADAYGKAGRLITFLAKCGDATAIAALGCPGMQLATVRGPMPKDQAVCVGT